MSLARRAIPAGYHVVHHYQQKDKGCAAVSNTIKLSIAFIITSTVANAQPKSAVKPFDSAAIVTAEARLHRHAIPFVSNLNLTRHPVREIMIRPVKRNENGERAK